METKLITTALFAVIWGAIAYTLMDLNPALSLVSRLWHCSSTALRFTWRSDATGSGPVFRIGTNAF